MKKQNKIFLIVLGFAVLTLIAGQLYAGFFSKYKKISATAGELVIPVEKVSDGATHYFVYDQGKEVKFFVVKSSDGVLRAAFDACDVCFPEKKGYSQEGEYMVCNNCGRKFHSTRINVVKGGCNPAPLKRVVQDGKLIIRVDDVLRGSHYF